MNKTTRIILVFIGIVFLFCLNSLFNNGPSTKKYVKDSSYYLASPWRTEKIGWFFINLPEKWVEDVEETKKSNLKIDEISNESHVFEMRLNGFFLVSLYMDVKKGFYENWNLDKSATALINQALYNLQCDSF
jgi:hypothetical protein